jgi:hypothetical protein
MCARVLGVMVAGVEFARAAAVVEFVTILKRAWVFGDGGGNETGPPTSGVRPVRLTSGVNPVLMNDGSKGRCEETLTEEEPFTAPDKDEELGCCCGPASIAGDKGPDRRDPVANHGKPDDGSEGDARDARGGRVGLGVADSSWVVFELPFGFVFPLLLLLPFELELGRESLLLLSGVGEGWRMEGGDLREENDCSNGFGSRSRLEVVRWGERLIA